MDYGEKMILEKAIFAYRYNDIGLNAVCLKYGIPKPTFKRYVERNYTFSHPPIDYDREFFAD